MGRLPGRFTVEEIVAVAQPSQLKKGEQLPQSLPSSLCESAFAAFAWPSLQKSNEQQGTAARNSM